MSNRPKHCKRCGKPATRSRTISRAGNCSVCGVKAFREAQRVNANGGVLADPAVHARWAEGMARAAQRAAESGPGATTGQRAS